MLNERFDEISRKADAPFLSAGAYGGALTPTVAYVHARRERARTARSSAGLAALEVEANRVEQHGFGAGELDRARKWLLASYDRAYAERDKTESGSLRAGVREPLPPGRADPRASSTSTSWCRHWCRRSRPRKSPTAAKAMFADTSRVILAVSPQKAGVTVPTDAQLTAAITSADAVAVTPWTDTASSAALLARAPDPGTVVDRREIPELGVTVVRLSNGVEAWLKPTDFKNDQVLFALAASGGSSLARAGEVRRGAAGHRRRSSCRAPAAIARSTCRS